MAFVLLAAGERGWRALARSGMDDLDGARWIWAEGVAAADGPVAFYAVRDFELAAPARSASLSVMADEEYVAYVNRRQIGSNRYTNGGTLDGYEVADELVVGANRLILELRSSRGLGGALAALRIDSEAGAVEIVTDAGWQVLRRHRRRIFDGRPVGGRPARVWGSPPIGRWGRVGERVARPVLSDLAPDLFARRPRRFAYWRVGRGWSGRRYPPGRLHGFGTPVLFDWGKKVTGYLALSYEIEESRPALAILSVGEKPPDPPFAVPNEFLIGVPGRTLWTAARPRTFRYVLVEGLPEVSGATVVVTKKALGAELEVSPDEVEKGVFGRRSPRLRSPVENELRRRLQSLESRSVGEDG